MDTLQQMLRNKSTTLAYERGVADSYYRRPPHPHYMTLGSTCSPLNMEVTNLTPEELEAYNNGYKDNANNGDFKDYGYGKDEE